MADTLPSPSSRRRKWIVRIGASLLTLLTFIILLLFALRFAATTPLGRNFVEARIEAASPAGQSIQIEGLQGDILGRFTFDRLTVSDEQGVWLTAHQFTGDWHPLALRNRRLFINELTAHEIQIDRQPILISAAPETAEKSDALPIKLAELEALTIKKLAISDDVTPQPVNVRIMGAAHISRNSGFLKLNIIPEGEKGDRLTTDLSWSEARPLTGTAEADGPAGGLFASLLGLDPTQRVTAAVKASGVPENWKASLTAFVDDSPIMRAETQGDQQSATFTAQANPQLHPGAVSFSNWFGQTVIADGNISLNQENRTLDATFTGANQRLVTTASMQENGDISADIRFEADTPHILLESDAFTLGQIVLDGVLVRTQDALSFDGTTSAHELTAGNVSISSLSGPINVKRENGNINLQTQLESSGLELPDALNIVTGGIPQITLDMQYVEDAQTLSLRAARYQSATTTLKASGDLSLGEAFASNIEGSINIDPRKKDPARSVRANATWRAHTDQSGTTKISLNGSASDVGELPEPVDQWVGKTIELDLVGALAPDGHINVSKVDIRADNLKLTGSLKRTNAGKLTVNTDVTAGHASAGSLQISSLSAIIHASGQPDDLAFNASIIVPTLTIDETSFETAQLVAEGTTGKGGSHADLSLKAMTSAGPLTAVSQASSKEDFWNVSDARLTWGELTATAGLRGQGSDLSTLRGEVIASGALPTFLPAENVNLDAKLEGETVQADFRLEQLTLGPIRNTDIDLDLSGTLQRANVELKLVGTSIISGLERPLDANLNGVITDAQSSDRALSSTANIQIGQTQINSNKPIIIAQSDRGIALDADLSALDGHIHVQISDDADKRLRLNVDDLALSEILSFTGRALVTGRVNGQLDIADAGPHLAGRLSGMINDLEESSGEISPLTLKIDGTLENEKLTIDLLSDDLDALTGQVQMTLPVTTSSDPMRVSYMPDSAITYKADMNGDIGSVSSVLIPPDIVLSGLVDLNLTGTLPLSRGDLQGSLQFNQGHFEHGGVGVVIHEINMASRITSGAITLDTFSALGRDGGTLSGDGILHLDNTAASTLTLDAEKLVVFKQREARATASGKLKIGYSQELFSIGGDLKINDALVNLDALPKSSKPTLEVVFREPDPNPEDTPQTKQNTALDVKITSKRGIKVRGQGIDASAGMNATLTGSFGDPNIVGTVNIVRGDFSLIGKRFVFQNSSLKIDGDPMTGTLDITAVRETNDIVATVNVTGTPRRPKIDLSSEPEFPEDEVLSRVIFGRSPAELSTLETARLASALAQLSGGGGFDLMGGVEDSLGLDTLDFGQSSEGGVQLTTGKYISNDVYLELTTGASGAPGLSLEWEPLNNVAVDAETIPGEGQSVAIKWKRDFE